METQVYMTMGINIKTRTILVLGFDYNKEAGRKAAEKRALDLGFNELNKLEIGQFPTLGQNKAKLMNDMVVWLADAGAVGVEISDAIDQIQLSLVNQLKLNL